MESFRMNNSGVYLPDEHLQTAESMLLTPLDDVFAEYDCLRKADGGDTPLAIINNASFVASDLTCGAPQQRPLVALEQAIRTRRPHNETSEASVPLVSTSAGASSDSGDEEYQPTSRGSAANSRPRAAAGVQKVKGKRSQRQSNEKVQELTELLARPDGPSMSGSLQPFDVIKNYGMGGTLSLQQLNTKIKSYCSTS